jgi:hypothetical protein
MPTEKPILFSGPMVRAILSGQKTVTRRLVKGGQIPTEDKTIPADGPRWSAIGQRHIRYGYCVFGQTEAECATELGSHGVCPYGKPGDRLWVRESTEADYQTHDAVVLSRYSADKTPVTYWDDDDGEPVQAVAHWNYPRDGRPSIHMTRAQCRIVLEITAVRVERLQDISEEQAVAEGCFFTDYGRVCGHGGNGWKEVGDCRAPEQHHPQRNGWMWDKTTSHEQCLGTARWAFGNLWENVNGAESWDANPWVWVVEFKRVTP